MKSSAEKIYTAAVIGCGRIGFTLGFDKKREQPASHTMALNANPRIKIVSGVDSNPENLALWKKHNPACAVFKSAEEMAGAVVPDIIVVSVNEDAHLGVTLKVLSLKPRLVILEKPVALDLKQASRIKSAAKKYGVPVLVNHERRFALDWNKAASYICEGKIGEVQSIDARLYSGMRLYDPQAEESGAYSLLHDGTHLADITLFLLERIQSAAVQDKKALSAAAGGKDGARAILKNPLVTGIVHDSKNKKVIRNLCAHYDVKCQKGGGSISVSLAMSGRSRFFGFECDIVGTEGRIHIGNGFAEFYRRAESKLYSGFYSLEKDKTVLLPKNAGRIQTGYFANMVQNAVDFLDKKSPLGSTLLTGINALRVLEDIKAALL